MKTTKGSSKKGKKKNSQKKILAKSAPRPRNKRIVFALNEAEHNALLSYCKKYNITNRSHLIRSTLMTSILKRFNEDYPTLFHEEEMH
ncbi:MAG: hypothetical protein PHE04_05475 [Bacteroidales bacterium]|nr:hypothetical protein [Bacteroidales bacterium]MDD3431908.1 hypothetical protein [Bacteroidales bacterium]MDD4362332.1 hypothetical protein [Bacteroidales bacterium]MDD4430976.1 hypothetical protein [Bacteroidales bacterium]